MNRSHRRGLAVTWSVAVGAAWAGLGAVGALGVVGAVSTGTAAPAVADDGSAPRGGDDSADGRGTPVSKATATSAAQRRTRTPGSALGDTGGLPVGLGDTAGTEGRCSWPNWFPVVFPVREIDGPDTGGGQLPVAPTTTPPRFLAGPPALGPVAERTLTALIPVTPVPAAKTFTTPLVVSLSPSPPTTPPSPSPSSSPPPPALQAEPTPGAGPVAGIPELVAAQEQPIRLGYPPYLQSASVQEIAFMALVGAAGLAALTGAGGFVGYRQAKAGFALRAGGTARFLP